MTTQKLIFKVIREIVRPIKQFFNLPVKFYNLYKDTCQYLAFPNAFIAYRGKFKSFKEAMDSRPKNHRKSFYSEAQNPNIDSFLAQVKNQKVGNMEYPVFYWLNEIAESCKDNLAFNVLDFGGGYGGHYFSFVNTAKILNPHNPFINNLQWQVVELPKQVEFGNKIAQTLGANNLHFITNLSYANTHNVLVASGVFQYVENVFDLLKEWRNRGGGEPHRS